MEKIKVIIIDDHKMIREGLQQLLELDGEIMVVGQAGDGIEGLNLIKNTRPDVVLLDINMPNMNGLEMLKELRNNGNDIKVLILTIHNEIEYLDKAINIGVNGYILKDSECSTLKKAIYTVYTGNSYIEPSLSPLLKEYKGSGMDGKDELMYANLLSAREIDVLKLLSTGLHNREIANVLAISEKTVKNHVSNIFRKLDVNDRTQAAVIAIKFGIISL